MTEFFIATLDDLNGLVDCRPLNEQFIADSEVDLLMLCNLESILTGAEWESVFDRDYINPLAEQGPDGPWIYKVSDKLINALEKLSSAESVAQAADQWSETDEWTLRPDNSPEKICAVIQGLIGLAKKAGEEGKSIFIWTEP